MLKKLRNRVLELSYKHKLAHIGSCLTALPVIYDILINQKEGDIFILSSGHAGVAYYVVLEELFGHDAEKLLLDMGIHPIRDLSRNIYCTTGSLGMGITVGVGYALGKPESFVDVLISDGESFEGSVWESLNFKSNKDLKNLRVHVNMNGYSAYSEVDKNQLSKKLLSFCPDITIHDTSDFTLGNVLDNSLKAHYYNLTEEDYRSLIK